MTTVFINGRFLSAPLTGVQRVAFQLLEALDSNEPFISDKLGLSFELLYPGGAAVAKYRNIGSRKVGILGGQAWEQFELARAASGGLLLNLCNMGPIAKRQSVTMIHDAQVHTSPKSYSAAFRLWYQFAHPTIGRFHRQILTVSSFSKAELVDRGIAAAERVSVIPNGCDHITRVTPDPSIVARLRLESGPFVVSTANTQHHKNIGILLQAFANRRLHDTRLILFGSATHKDFEAAGHHVPSNVVFAGRLRDEEVAGLLGSALCLACPSLTEGFGLMPLEAMALGCPAIIAPCGGLAEVCAGAALMAAPDDPIEWIRQIEQLTYSPGLREEMTQLGRERASHYTWRNSASMLVGELSRIISAHPRTHASSHAATHELV
ncbi:Glycosyl transferases group 1 [Rhizobium sp. NFR07]|uniref:glycosyltransferase family 4 protein n=1 Tax=Rhizobium sp. NFR07 TaxID=1566262 RepID=UPI0008E08A49|nr:glycosyltransferase family 1 protein [Rhizobium sp. NFR07]SFB62957.1 Glycosyl transferases group 1 [Rhizobium sp. NFR07]